MMPPHRFKRSNHIYDRRFVGISPNQKEGREQSFLRVQYLSVMRGRGAFKKSCALFLSENFRREEAVA